MGARGRGGGQSRNEADVLVAVYGSNKSNHKSQIDPFIWAWYLYRKQHGRLEIIDIMIFQYITQSHSTR